MQTFVIARPGHPLAHATEQRHELRDVHGAAHERPVGAELRDAAPPLALELAELDVRLALGRARRVALRAPRR
jgi:hypothetical protein